MLKLKRLNAMTQKEVQNLSIVKPVSGHDLRDTARLLWTNIGMRTNLDPALMSLLFSGAVSEDDKTPLCTNLVEYLALLGKRVLLIDLDKQGARFKQAIGYDTNSGFTDLCYKFFDEPFFSRQASDYGLTDLLTLFFLKSRTGRLTLTGSDTPSIKITFFQGRPIEIEGAGDSLSLRVITAVKHLKAGEWENLIDGTLSGTIASYMAPVKANILAANELGVLIDNLGSALIAEIRTRSAGLFEYADLPAELFAEAATLIPERPSYLQEPPVPGGFIARQIEHFCVTSQAGFKFMPHGQFPIKSGEIAARYKNLLPLFRAFFDIIVINAPAYPTSPLTREMARIADGTVLVVKSGAIDRRDFGKILSDMRTDNVNLLGAVLNEVDTEYQRVL